MKIIAAKHAGFCFGVKNAIDSALREAKVDGSSLVYTLGELIHNTAVIDELRKKGVVPIDELSKIEPNSTLLLRYPGVGEAVYKEAEKRELRLVDAT